MNKTTFLSAILLASLAYAETPSPEICGFRLGQRIPASTFASASEEDEETNAQSPRREITIPDQSLPDIPGTWSVDLTYDPGTANITSVKATARAVADDAPPIHNGMKADLVRRFGNPSRTATTDTFGHALNPLNPVRGDFMKSSLWILGSGRYVYLTAKIYANPDRRGKIIAIAGTFDKVSQREFKEMFGNDVFLD